LLNSNVRAVHRTARGTVRSSGIGESALADHQPEPIMKYRLALLALMSAFAATSFAQGSPAASAAPSTWQKNHPRRVEVNKRLANQDRRIKQERAEGEISKTKVAQLHKDDRQIRQEERDMAAQDKGHITKTDQRALNQQENQVSKQIGK